MKPIIPGDSNINFAAKTALLFHVRNIEAANTPGHPVKTFDHFSVSKAKEL